MLRMSHYENWLACRLVRMYLRHTRTECSDWIGVGWEDVPAQQISMFDYLEDER